MIGHFKFKLLEDDVRSAAHEGVWMAFSNFNSAKGKDINRHIKCKGFYKTIDILRKEKLLTKEHYIRRRIRTHNEHEEIDLGCNCITAKNYVNFDKTWFELTDGLNDFHTKVLYMRYIEKRTINEMMEIMKISKHAVNQAIYEARKKLCELHKISSEDLVGKWATRGARSK